MSYPFICIEGDINKPEEWEILGAHLTRVDAEIEARKYLEQYPNRHVHIYEWEAAFRSTTTVNVEREYYSGYVVPVEPTSLNNPEEPA